MFERRLDAPPREPGSGVKVVLYVGEPIDAALRRFKKLCDRTNVIKDYRRHEHFISRSERRRQKSDLARKRRDK
jgi:small subunit ribosomal protein S21